MKKEEPIGKIMTTDVITLNLSNTLYTAEKRLKKNNIRHIPVVNGKRLMGMISLSDILRISFIDAYNEEGTVDTAIYNMMSIEDLMIKNLVTVSSDTPIYEVAKLLANKKFHSLPIVDDEHLVGIVTTTDLLNYFVENC
ncbi:CBS domain-containing protein [Namhaeicola litoreus]|uniref:CBS domain-containing protein n=1 Tax=Namhaeicola litoreus TaxID=1052145 RepID=A0ABW3XXK8_9FLAO